MSSQSPKTSSVSTEQDGSGKSPAPATFGANEWLVDEIYQQYLQDPNSVDRAWWDFFADYKPSPGGGEPKTGGGAPASPPTAGCGLLGRALRSGGHAAGPGFGPVGRRGRGRRRAACRFPGSVHSRPTAPQQAPSTPAKPAEAPEQAEPQERAEERAEG